MEGEGKSVEMKIDEKRDYLIQLNNKRFLIENGYWNDSATDWIWKKLSCCISSEN